LVLRRTSDTGQQQQQSEVGRRSGWGAIGVVVDYTAMREVRVKNMAGINGEIGDEMSALYRCRVTDSWQILFGNCDTEVYDVTKLIYGFNLYHKAKVSPDLQKLCGIELAQLNSNCVPPGMKKVVVAGQPNSKSSKTQKLSSPAHLEVNGECTKYSGSKGLSHDVLTSATASNKTVSLNSVPVNSTDAKANTSLRPGNFSSSHSIASISDTAHVTSSKLQCRICGCYRIPSGGIGSPDVAPGTPSADNPFVTEDGYYYCVTCLRATLSLSLSGQSFCSLYSSQGKNEREVNEGMAIRDGTHSDALKLSNSKLINEGAKNSG
jgi:hypothetical protein